MLILDELHNWLLLMDLKVGQITFLKPTDRSLLEEIRKRSFQFHKLFHRQNGLAFADSRKPKLPKGLT